MFQRVLKSFLFAFTLAALMSSCVMFRPSPAKLFARAEKQQPYDVIIVPGIPFDGKNWNSIMKSRVLWSQYLIEAGIAKNVIYSGSAVYTPYVEAKIMALYGEALGIPRENIFVETEAQHSTENVYNSYQMAKKLGFTKIAVATDPFQSAMLMGFTKRRFKLPIAHIPFKMDNMAVLDDIQDPSIEPGSAFVEDFRAITETQTFWYRMRGTMGKNIAFTGDE